LPLDWANDKLLHGASIYSTFLCSIIDLVTAPNIDSDNWLHIDCWQGWGYPSGRNLRIIPLASSDNIEICGLKVYST